MASSFTSSTHDSITLTLTLDDGNDKFIRWYLDNRPHGGDTICYAGQNVYSHYFSGLSPNTLYNVTGDIYRYSTGTFIEWHSESVITKPDPNPNPRPNNWSWFTPKFSGGNFNITASEWTAFQNRINEFRVQYKGLGKYFFTPISTGQDFEAYLYRQAINAIWDLGPNQGLPPNRYSGDDIYAIEIDQLRLALNSVYK